jgi:hypothetical protein
MNPVPMKFWSVLLSFVLSGLLRALLRAGPHLIHPQKQTPQWMRRGTYISLRRLRKVTDIHALSSQSAVYEPSQQVWPLK